MSLPFLFVRMHKQCRSHCRDTSNELQWGYSFESTELSNCQAEISGSLNFSFFQFLLGQASWIYLCFLVNFHQAENVGNLCDLPFS